MSALITCTGCNKKFACYRDFADHRVGAFKDDKPGSNRACLDNDLMVERGYRFIDGVWSKHLPGER